MAISFSANIRPLFRDKDIRAMKALKKFDLSEYNDVHKNADTIVSSLSNRSMPCDADGKWSEEHIQLFRDWIKEGKMP